ncbi:rhomboid family intramembrane serine protease [Candidatus Saccharibacteria bacterium]|nr:MAG: rhomboid family intramembrane serine protease [Candidatus Saccharibacteria bacterium]
MFFIPFGTKERTRRQRFPYVTWALVLANIAVFAYQIYLQSSIGPAAFASFINLFATTPTDITDGTPFELSLLTSMFMHAGLLHIAGNMIYLLPFGDNVEDRLGHVRYIIFYLLCGFIATLVYVLFNPNSTIPLLGASGAIAGVLAGYLALHPTGSVKGLLIIIIFVTRISLPAFIFIGYWIATQIFYSVSSFGTMSDEGGVAFLAHVAGFVAGLVLAPLLAAGRPKQDQAQEFLG